MQDQKPASDSLKFAIFNGTEEITEEMYKEVLDFANHIRKEK